jgi:hypothetical protein
MILVMLLLTGLSSAQEEEHIKWYGIGGELTEPHRWFGRVGITQYLGAEIIFGIEHISRTCDSGNGDCDFTSLDVGAGFIYDFAPAKQITPYLGGRFVLTMTGNGESETSGTVEAAAGVEYVIMKRVGLSGELNFGFSTNPTHVLTRTKARFYFYL